MAVTLAALKTEIETGPLAAELAPNVLSGSDQAIADALNRVGILTIDRELLVAQEVADSIVWSEFAALTVTQPQRDAIRAILATGTVNLKNVRIRQAFLDIFPGGTSTRANIVALQTRPCSQAEKAWGAGTRITHLEVARALRPSVVHVESIGADGKTIVTVKVL